MNKEKAVLWQTAESNKPYNYYTTLEAVKKYLALDLPIIPLGHLKKTPRIKGESWKRKHTLDEFQEGDNIGLICGLESNGAYFAAFDFDSPNPKVFVDLMKELEAQGITGLIQKSGGKHSGYHYIIKTDEPIKNAHITFKGCEIDVKGTGGYILIAPSVVEQQYLLIEGSFEDLQTVKSTAVNDAIKQLGGETNNCNGDILNTVVGSEEKYPFYLTPDGKIVVDNFKSLFNTFAGWKILFDAYNIELPLELNKNFNSLYVLHGKRKNTNNIVDEHPSAEFYRGNNGTIVYRDFAVNRTYTLPEVWHALKTNEAPLIKDAGMRKALLSKWTAEFIDELKIYTQDAINYQESFNEFIDEAIKREDVPERFVKVWRVIANKMMRVYDHGGDIFSARWLAKEAGIRDHVIANKALNLLAACGLVRKGDNKVLQDGKDAKVTQIIEPVKDFEVYTALDILSLLHEDLRRRKCRWGKFSRKAVINVLGTEVANAIFTRDRDDVEENITEQEDEKSEVENEEGKETQGSAKRKTSRKRRKQHDESKEHMNLDFRDSGQSRKEE